ncbi:MAG: hypothetical protein OXU20_17290 [Myxococcales bacterium]|nr:hypothetical protein [Myxococcales bacterium]
MPSKRKRSPGAGRPPKIKGFAVMTTRLPHDLLSELRLHAALHKVSVSDLARDILKEWCQAQPEHSRVRGLVRQHRAPR